MCKRKRHISTESIKRTNDARGAPHPASFDGDYIYFHFESFVRVRFVCMCACAAPMSYALCYIKCMYSVYVQRMFELYTLAKLTFPNSRASCFNIYIVDRTRVYHIHSWCVWVACSTGWLGRGWALPLTVQHFHQHRAPPVSPQPATKCGSVRTKWSKLNVNAVNAFSNFPQYENEFVSGCCWWGPFLLLQSTQTNSTDKVARAFSVYIYASFITRSTMN